MIVIFMRHGIAEDASQNQPDAARHLTEKGLKRLTESMPGLCAMMRSFGQPLIFSSPLCRAAETAHVLAKAFKVAEVHRLEAIATGCWPEICQHLKRMKTDQPVLIVGHEPSLGNWTGQLCGVRLPFKKGAASAIRLASTDAEDADLLWFLQPGALRLLAQAADLQDLT